jgi:tRNA threonylcarbamoyladenosine biosynthesis protein TsaB
MALILLIETATPTCSVALASEKGVLAQANNHQPKSHAAQLNNLIQQVMDESGQTFDALQAVAVSKGPGSYTGLRIGVSTAKGFCYALNIPLIAINTLQAYTAQAIRLFYRQQTLFKINKHLPVLFVPMLDARRMEVYTAVFDAKGTEVLPTQTLILTADAYSELLTKNNVVFFGDGATKWHEIAHTYTNTFFLKVDVSAEGLFQLAFEKFAANSVEDTAYFEPYYLKDFVTTTPKKK